jgi:putative FmdB family regulatory protein
MPIYEFACRGCGNQFETLVRGALTPSCSECGSVDLERLLSAFGVKTEAGSKSALGRAKRDQKIADRDRVVAERERINSHDH